MSDKERGGTAAYFPADGDHGLALRGKRPATTAGG